ncbi:hypothetical protein OS493_012392 [Desmophyllum pertusum]|uniref:GRF-type domain-containing protein n=1 Tax=Desmophyllum pertusum TaxID=174260 RepID=A0A9W9ZQH0_9CNID|nr:hypothetical protein OS493_012392 [Desmophyllum pertusum]
MLHPPQKHKSTPATRSQQLCQFFICIFPSSGVVVAVPKAMSFAACTLCHRGTRKEFPAKVDGKEYVRCKNKLCAFFCSINRFEEYDDIVINDVHDFYKGLDAPKCYHDQPSILKIKNELYVQKKNRGKPYFICAQKQRCPYFAWSDTESEPVLPDEKVNPALWIQTLEEKRRLILDMKKQHRVVIEELVKRINLWRDRFSDLLETLLCFDCNEEKNEAYLTRDDDLAKAWHPTNCWECRNYRRFCYNEKPMYEDVTLKKCY